MSAGRTSHTISACRICGHTDLAPVIDLGDQPLANALVEPGSDRAEARHPLAVVRCRGCSLVQLTVTVAPDEMFSDYPYFSSTSTSFVEAMGKLARRTARHERLGPDSLVVEIASNDGYLLSHYRDLGVPVLGVDPAANVAAVAEQRGVPTVVDFFGTRVAGRLRDEGRSADVIHANNVIAHVPELGDVLSGIAQLLAPGGVALIETPHLVEMIRRLEFDTIYHEHVFYHSLTALGSALARHGLVVADVERIPTHGGSLRLHVRHQGAEVSRSVTDLLSLEQQLGVETDEYYASFAGQVEAARTRTMAALRGLRDEGTTIAGYGAAAKATVLCNYFGIDADVVEYVVDRSPAKQGRLIPGVRIPILAPEELERRRPDATVLFAWNLRDEILEQQAAYVAGGGAFVVPMPDWELILT